MKRTKESVVLDRRTLLAAAAGGGVSIAGGQVWAAPTSPVADAHIHVFNGSDLPVGHFVQYVFLPDRYPQLPPWADAIGDFIVNVIKPLAITVRKEAGQPAVAAALTSGTDVTPELFGQVAGDYVAERSRPPGSAARGAAPFDPAMAASYRELMKGIAGGPVGMLQQFSTDPRTGSLRMGPADRVLLRGAFTAVARMSEAPARRGGVNLELLNPLATLDALGRLIGWLYLMTRSRQTHIDKYLSDYATPGAAPKLVVNHLVDYDRWLDDGPSTDSPHIEQVALMATLAQRNKAKVDLRTFAGFCPLKNALETAVDPSNTTLAAFQAAYGRGELAGFKIYPPMGFRAFNNTELKDEDFARPAGADVVLKQWRAVAKDAPLGAALDASLLGFYRWCAKSDIPLQAHGGPGNQAAPGFGERANPIFWEAAQKRLASEGLGLRLNIGHLVHDVPAFIAAVDAGPPYPKAVWALDASIRMLGAGPKGTIYGDLAFMPELVDDATLRTKFFKALKTAFGPVDPDLRHVLYGTDWILLRLEHDSMDFLGAVIQGMTDAGYTETEKTNILYANARRFLKLDPV
jgi:predicted TIM-barrel fold metal-dependent hydrolase